MFGFLIFNAILQMLIAINLHKLQPRLREYALNRLNDNTKPMLPITRLWLRKCITQIKYTFVIPFKNIISMKCKYLLGFRQIQSNFFPHTSRSINTFTCFLIVGSDVIKKKAILLYVEKHNIQTKSTTRNFDHQRQILSSINGLYQN